MKKMILVLMPLALLPGQQKKAAPKTAPAAQAAPAPASPSLHPASGQAEALKIPQGAKEVEPYLYSFTDAQGKKWIYKQTPFGVVRWEDKPATATPVDNSNPVVITDLGDSVRFQWKTPFGNQTRVRKKSELTDEEKATITQNEQQSKAATPADPKAGAKPSESARKTAEKQ